MVTPSNFRLTPVMDACNTIDALPASIKTLDVRLWDRFRRGRYALAVNMIDDLWKWFDHSHVTRINNVFRQTSQQIESFTLKGIPVGVQLFWPDPPALSSQAEPYWPNLSKMRVELLPSTPDGEPLFRPRDHSRTGMEAEMVEYFNTHKADVNKDELNKLYRAIAQAATRMPRLESLILNAMIDPAIHIFELEITSSSVHATWCVNSDFEPDDQVMEALGQLALHKGKRLKVDTWDGLGIEEMTDG
ncbi:hypothetical protein F4778DRAFT_761873 [Xylariomycetidae sp. FL2044]|nr:hypothetical protein F4778DRAFT_761873 [Xylariomycetidae sp. FL2044]